MDTLPDVPAREKRTNLTGETLVSPPAADAANQSDASALPRRAFLGAVGAAALAVTAEASAVLTLADPPEPVYQSPEPSNDLFVRICGKGESEWVENFYSNEAEAMTFRRHSEKTSRLERRRFEPLADEKRFIVVRFDWDIPSPFLDFRYIGDGPPKSVLQSYHEAKERLSLPASFVELPPGFSGSCECVSEDGPFTLAEGLARVARLNTEQVESEGGAVDMEWCGLIELGESPGHWFHVDVDANGIGSVDKVIGDPCRVYRPTPAELAAHPIEWMSEGGAS